MNKNKIISIQTFLWLFFCLYATNSYALNVVTTIKPLQMIAKAIAHDMLNIDLLLDPNTSPHDFQLQPSQVQKLNKADLILWIGEDLEASLAKPIAKINPCKIVNILTIPKLKVLKYRAKKDWTMYYHQARQPYSDHETQSHHHHHHDSNSNDPHVWLSPKNVALIASHISEQFIVLDPLHAQIYKENLNKFLIKLNQHDNSWQSQLKQIEAAKILVTHDAFQYLEKHFNVHVVGAILLESEIPISAKHYQELEKLIKTNKVDCVCEEPQMHSKTLQALMQKSNVKHLIIDPIGIDVDIDINSYFVFMDKIVNQLSMCA